MKEFIEEQAVLLVEDLQYIAETICEKEVTDMDECSRIIWEDGSTRDVAHASNTCGRLSMLRKVTYQLDLEEEISDETRERFRWANLIDPA